MAKPHMITMEYSASCDIEVRDLLEKINEGISTKYTAEDIRSIGVKWEQVMVYMIDGSSHEVDLSGQVEIGDTKRPDNIVVMDASFDIIAEGTSWVNLTDSDKN
jgi:hypothetical protein